MRSGQLVNETAKQLRLEPGVHVLLGNLMSRSNLNGKHGIVIGLVEAFNPPRWMIKFDRTSGEIRLKRENMVLINPLDTSPSPSPKSTFGRLQTTLEIMLDSALRNESSHRQSLSRALRRVSLKTLVMRGNLRVLQAGH